jgi:hypothetical protein
MAVVVTDRRKPSAAHCLRTFGNPDSARDCSSASKSVRRSASSDTTRRSSVDSALAWVDDSMTVRLSSSRSVLVAALPAH